MCWKRTKPEGPLCRASRRLPVSRLLYMTKPGFTIAMHLMDTSTLLTALRVTVTDEALNISRSEREAAETVESCSNYTADKIIDQIKLCVRKQIPEYEEFGLYYNDVAKTTLEGNATKELREISVAASDPKICAPEKQNTLSACVKQTYDSTEFLRQQRLREMCDTRRSCYMKTLTQNCRKLLNKSQELIIKCSCNGDININQFKADFFSCLQGNKNGDHESAAHLILEDLYYGICKMMKTYSVMCPNEIRSAGVRCDGVEHFLETVLGIVNCLRLRRFFGLLAIGDTQRRKMKLRRRLRVERLTPTSSEKFNAKASANEKMGSRGQKIEEPKAKAKVLDKDTTKKPQPAADSTKDLQIHKSQIYPGAVARGHSSAFTVMKKKWEEKGYVVKEAPRSRCALLRRRIMLLRRILSKKARGKTAANKGKKPQNQSREPNLEKKKKIKSPAKCKGITEISFTRFFWWIRRYLCGKSPGVSRSAENGLNEVKPAVEHDNDGSRQMPLPEEQKKYATKG
ncbi:unnamed protein product [Soboliphyme baturini]|uniref:Golgi apparatus protein 1 n=1 Tax=Soboliphyme baturini TaxID=241478 RepID=A0A183IKZ0_9BILA|nr:unnamed protein product [Soboliphyme baturini]